MIPFLIGGALAFVAVVVTALPFLRARRATADDAPQAGAAEAEGVRLQREGIYRALETLQLERELGQVDDDEYARQVEDYRRQAALLVREQERLQGQADDATAALERAVREARARREHTGDPPP